MVCNGIRKHHRYKPTQYEVVYLKLREESYPHCLECGTSKSSNKSENKK